MADESLSYEHFIELKPGDRFVDSILGMVEVVTVFNTEELKKSFPGEWGVVTPVEDHG
jgi:hypothetical protein